MCSVYEHCLYPGKVVHQPCATLELYLDDKLLMTYGFYLLSREQLSDAILFRMTQILGVSCVDPGLSRSWARAEDQTRWARFEYDPQTLSYLVNY